MLRHSTISLKSIAKRDGTKLNKSVHSVCTDVQLIALHCTITCCKPVLRFFDQSQKSNFFEDRQNEEEYVRLEEGEYVRFHD